MKIQPDIFSTCKIASALIHRILERNAVDIRPAEVGMLGLCYRLYHRDV